MPDDINSIDLNENDGEKFDMIIDSGQKDF